MTFTFYCVDFYRKDFTRFCRLHCFFVHHRLLTSSHRDFAVCYYPSPHPPNPFFHPFGCTFSMFVTTVFFWPLATTVPVRSYLFYSCPLVLCPGNFVLKGFDNRIGYMCIISKSLHFGLYYPVLLLPVLFELVLLSSSVSDNISHHGEQHSEVNHVTKFSGGCHRQIIFSFQDSGMVTFFLFLLNQ